MLAFETCHAGIKTSLKGIKKVRKGKSDRMELKGSVGLRAERETLGEESSGVRPGDCE